jgi:hypothetical protein
LEVDVQEGDFKILQLLPQVLILFLVEKWTLPSRSETAEIGKKTEGILGVKAGSIVCSCVLDPETVLPMPNDLNSCLEESMSWFR